MSDVAAAGKALTIVCNTNRAISLYWEWQRWRALVDWVVTGNVEWHGR